MYIYIYKQSSRVGARLKKKVRSYARAFPRDKRLERVSELRSRKSLEGKRQLRAHARERSAFHFFDGSFIIPIFEEARERESFFLSFEKKISQRIHEF